MIRTLGGQDLQLLGLGHNGHIGFNEPDAIFEKATHCVDLQESTIEANKRFFASADDVPKQAYTMGIGTIMQAKKILVCLLYTSSRRLAELCIHIPHGQQAGRRREEEFPATERLMQIICMGKFHA